MEIQTQDDQSVLVNLAYMRMYADVGALRSRCNSLNPEQYMELELSDDKEFLDCIRQLIRYRLRTKLFEMEKELFAMLPK